MKRRWARAMRMRKMGTMKKLCETEVTKKRTPRDLGGWGYPEKKREFCRDNAWASGK